MAALLNVQNNICYLDSLNQRYRLLYPKLSTLSEEEKRELLDIKKETLETLGQIMSVNCEDILSKNFAEKVSLISQGITSVLNEKEGLLDDITSEHGRATDIIEEIAKDVCKLETLNSNLMLRFDIEKLLFYLKNKVVNISLVDKKLYALEYLRDKLENYKIGLYKLINLSRKHISKQELSFEEKQEVFEIFSSISFEYHYDANHSKVYNEDLSDKTLNLNTSDYIVWLELIFLEMLEAVGVKLESYINEILSLVTESNVTKTNIENYITFLGKKYDSDIVQYYDTLVDKKIASVTDIRSVLKNSFIYEENKNYEYILNKINKNHRLPQCLIDNRYKKYLEDLLFDYEFKNKVTKDNELKIINEVADIMFEKFDPQLYMDIYDYNTKQKNKQISLYRQYLTDLLDKAKETLRSQYITELENKIEENMLAEYNTSKANDEKKKMEKDVAILRRAKENIKDRFSSFDEYSYKKYIYSIESAYGIEGLSTEISIRRKSIFSNLKAKTPNKKDIEYIEEFLKSEEINRELMKNLAYDIIVGNDSIRYEVLSKILK